MAPHSSWNVKRPNPSSGQPSPLHSPLQQASGAGAPLADVAVAHSVLAPAASVAGAALACTALASAALEAASTVAAAASITVVAAALVRVGRRPHTARVAADLLVAPR